MSTTLSGLRNIPGIRGVTHRLDRFTQRASFALRGAGYYALAEVRRNSARPGIAAVTIGRNDDYMADFRQRLHATIEWNTRHLVDEVVFVEWNPPADRELLSYELAARFKNLRAYVVPAETHHAINRNPNLQMLEYHAKNVGIRRARSPWVLATNGDAAVGMDTVKTLRRAQLDPDVIWTTERVDINWRENEQEHIDLLTSLRYRYFIPYVDLGTGEFNLASKQMWDRSRGYDESLVRHKIGCDRRGIAQMLAHGGRIKKAGTVLHLQHPTSCVEGVRPFHGEMATIEGVPYTNPEDWGLANARETPLAERVWRLEIE
ncbi:MAG: hypothetical protein QOE33_2461 [Acidobacteriota bacterium]|nr:hypothetical protein [Acidobacteriota bacterium]